MSSILSTKTVSCNTLSTYPELNIESHLKFLVQTRLNFNHKMHCDSIVACYNNMARDA